MNEATSIQHPAQAADWRQIPLSKLRRSPNNVRKVKAVASHAPLKDNTSSLTTLQHSLLAIDLLQNLIVVEAEDGFYDVWAGGERLENLHDLAAKGKIADDHAVMCRIVDQSIALTASLSENTHRSPMHPADEFDAMHMMVIVEKKSVEDVAAIFGFTPGVITRRLRLAELSPKVMAEFREGKADLKQMMALTLAKDHATQESIYFSLPEGRRHAHELKAQATQGEVPHTHRLSVFVGLESYEAAGGAIRRDLFEDVAYLADKGLLLKLASERLQAIADDVRAEGWQWVEVIPEIAYNAYWEYERCYARPRPLTAEEKAQIDSLNAKCGTLNNALREAEEIDDLEQAQTLEEQLEAASTELEELEESFTQFTPEDIARSGVIIGVNNSGALEVTRGLAKKSKGKGTATGAEDAPKDTGPKTPVLSERMARQLTTHKTAAMQLLLAQSPQIALASVVHSMAMRVIHNELYYAFQIPVGVSLTQRGGLKDLAPDYEDSRAKKELDALVAPWRKRLPKNPEKLFPALLKLSMEELTELMAVCVAHGVDAVEGEAGKPKSPINVLARTLNLDMTEWWTATADGYFSQVPKALTLEAVKSFAPDDVEQLAAMKKGPMAAQAEALAVDKKWLPPILK